VRHASLPAAVRYGAVPAVFLPAIAVYALVYRAVSGILSDLPVVAAPTELTALHGVVAAVFVGVYVAMELGVHERSGRLYVLLLNAGQPAPRTVLTDAEDYNEY
jgi:NAD(P)H-quinone oxidoreductase subunit 5